MLKDETTELEQMRKMLQNSSQWVGSTREEREVVHHKQCPEYWIEKVPCQIQTGYEYYLFNQTDSWPDWYDINLYHNQTILASIGGINLDGGRCFSSTPETRFFSVENSGFPLMYKCFIQGSVRFVLHEFFYSGMEWDEQYAHDCFEECVLFFRNKEEQCDFEKYVQLNWSRRDELAGKVWVPYFETVPDYDAANLSEEYENVQVLKILQQEFRATATGKYRNLLP